MNAKDVLRFNMTMADFVWTKGMADLSDDDLFVRNSPTANHLAWQWGHLISSEHKMVEQMAPGSCPALPEGFDENHAKTRAQATGKQGFLKKDEYAELHGKQREATLAVVDKMTDADLDAPAPEGMREFFPTVGSLMALQGLHQMWHMGLMTAVRRQLNKPQMFE